MTVNRLIKKGFEWFRHILVNLPPNLENLRQFIALSLPFFVGISLILTLSVMGKTTETISAMTTEYTVETSEELQAAYEALQANPGGGTILVKDTGDRIELKVVGSSDDLSNPVTIKSYDPNDPTVISRVAVSNAKNVTVDGFEVNSIGVERKSHHEDLFINKSDNVSVLNTTFENSADGFLLYGKDSASSMGEIVDSTDVTFAGNHISKYAHGLLIKESQGVEVSGNEFTELQADGIRMVSVQDIWITDNHMHDFYGSTHSVNHDDMIQMWSVGASEVSKNITISGNFFNAGDGAGTQTIFLGNEEAYDDPPHIYENITITDNVIFNGHSHGITVDASKGVMIENNTVLWNREAEMFSNAEDTDGASSAPTIRLSRTEDAQVHNNITADVVFKFQQSDDQTTGNFLVNYTDPTDPNYVDMHFINAETGGTVDMRDLRLWSESPWFGEAGASETSLAMQSDSVQAVMVSEEGGGDAWTGVFDAQHSFGPNGDLNGHYSYTWTFSDGVEIEGVQVQRNFLEPGDYDVTLDVRKDGAVVDSITRTY